jgi:hypothetical protein
MKTSLNIRMNQRFSRFSESKMKLELLKLKPLLP